MSTRYRYTLGFLGIGYLLLGSLARAHSPAAILGPLLLILGAALLYISLSEDPEPNP